MPVTILEEKKVRVIVNTDAKNEVDDLSLLSYYTGSFNR